MKFLPESALKERFKRWIESLGTKQRRVASLGLMALVASILIFGMLIPAWKYRSNAVEELRRSTGALEWMQSEEGRAKVLMEQVRLEQRTGTELPTISKLAQEAGLSRRQVGKSASGGVTVATPEDKYEDVVKFLSLLSAQGYSVVQLRMDSLRSGRISANLEVRR